MENSKKLKEVAEKLKGRELFPVLTQNARDLLASMDNLPHTEKPELFECRVYPQTWEEFIDKWIQSKVRFRPEEVYSEKGPRGEDRQYYPVHPKGSSNRPWMEENMMKHIQYLLSKEIKKKHIN